ncbi:ATP-binding protein [Caballeronia sp. LZ035]|uniref:AAA family ATPase n=1 Tax=Caballeronia sp. LZ035 TaxID=3038568 RepID=UPI002867202E|nr:ATP-binding protein [Caballeronia sp. LZ035]MDR5761465.1 ATP-binding protein [Caballeronia sp. LZ035]
MSPINVLLVAVSPDVKAEGISACIADRPDMLLVGNGITTVEQANAQLFDLPVDPQCAVIVVGFAEQTARLAEQWLAARTDLVVLCVDIVEDFVRLSWRDPSLDALLSALCGLVQRAGSYGDDRVSRISFPAMALGGPSRARAAPGQALIDALLHWVHEALYEAILRNPGEQGDITGLSVTARTLLRMLDDARENAEPEAPQQLAEAKACFSDALARADTEAEPFAGLCRRLRFDVAEARMLALALAPELDLRCQRCFGFLLDDMSRRTGTIVLFSSLVGTATRVRSQLASTRSLTRWRIFDSACRGMLAADEAARLDPPLAAWLLGDRDALDEDARVRHAMRTAAWPGAALLDVLPRARACSLIARLREAPAPHWSVVAEASPTCRAMIECGAEHSGVRLARVETHRLVGLDIGEIEETAVRIARLAHLTGRLIAIDVTPGENASDEDEALRALFESIHASAASAMIVCQDGARIARLLADMPYTLIDVGALRSDEHERAVALAARTAGIELDAGEAACFAARYPLGIDGFAEAGRLASAHSPRTDGHDDSDSDGALRERFAEACKLASARGNADLFERIEPAFRLDDIVLPVAARLQLKEVVDSVRLAGRVLDEWKFGAQLPYGRGVTALFHGPSGTGKTMAALGIARELGVQVLRIDLSRVVSKYIGDTEKHLDRVFGDAQRSGAALLIDEADALFGKRGEVRNAHDRYANIEVAYLLQRVEAFTGLAMLTTNLSENVDAAFLRRLRFIVEFPRPDLNARIQIWRRCLPNGSHTLDDAAFRQLGRSIELTGGHIRQITLRAAFLAAAAGAHIDTTHIAHAARAELAKLGMPLADFPFACRRNAA